VDALQLARPLEVLHELDWVGSLESDEEGAQRLVLIVPPESTALMPLAHRLLLPQESFDFWRKDGLSPSQNLRGTLLN
jgi:hypothetical protein